MKIITLLIGGACLAPCLLQAKTIHLKVPVNGLTNKVNVQVDSNTGQVNVNWKDTINAKFKSDSPYFSEDVCKRTEDMTETIVEENKPGLSLTSKSHSIRFKLFENVVDIPAFLTTIVSQLRKKRYYNIKKLEIENPLKVHGLDFEYTLGSDSISQTLGEFSTNNINNSLTNSIEANLSAVQKYGYIQVDTKLTPFICDIFSGEAQLNFRINLEEILNSKKIKPYTSKNITSISNMLVKKFARIAKLTKNSTFIRNNQQLILASSIYSEAHSNVMKENLKKSYVKHYLKLFAHIFSQESFSPVQLNASDSKRIANKLTITRQQSKPYSLTVSNFQRIGEYND
ncbi:MAG: hypothetical protein HOO06_11810 [Bdellovibrionaceae bacterium]|jgi:hypothetical protein|nr:hypothetical protein [Pseudobdellovibrionaceae bacterium]